MKEVKEDQVKVEVKESKERVREVKEFKEDQVKVKEI